MNSALAELLHPLTSAALQPSSCAPSEAGAAYSIKSCSDDVRWVGRVLSSMTFVATTIAVDSNKKPPCPKPGQARRLLENGVVVCISVNQCPVWRSLFTFTLFHVRKVHENLIGAQPAHWRIARFFSSYARQFTYTPRIARIHRRQRTSSCALDRVGKCDCRVARKIIASKRVNCRLGVCDHHLIAARCAPPASESGSARTSPARCRHLPFSNSSRL